MKYKKGIRKNNCEVCGVDNFAWVKVSENSYYKGLSVHHKIPRSKRGNDFPENLITLCEVCHRNMHTVNGVLNWSKIA